MEPSSVVPKPKLKTIPHLTWVKRYESKIYKNQLKREIGKVIETKPKWNVKKFVKVEKYIKEYRCMAQEDSRLNNMKKRNTLTHLKGEDKLVFVVRIGGFRHLHPKVDKVMRLLHLTKIYYGIFMKLTKVNLMLLSIVEPYITYGYPNLKIVRQIVYKKGFSRFRGEHIPLVSNKIIEKRLGQYNIICVEDLVHEIYTIGPHFKEVNTFFHHFEFLAPFMPKRDITKPYKIGGAYGNRKCEINDLLQKMI